MRARGPVISEEFTGDTRRGDFSYTPYIRGLYYTSPSSRETVKYARLLGNVSGFPYVYLYLCQGGRRGDNSLGQRQREAFLISRARVYDLLTGIYSYGGGSCVI